MSTVKELGIRKRLRAAKERLHADQSRLSPEEKFAVLVRTHRLVSEIASTARRPPSDGKR